MNPALLDALRLAGGYNASVVVLGCAAFGLAAGSLGCFVLLRGRALVADAAAHATLPGIALAFILAALLGGDVRSLPLLLAGGAASAGLGVLAIGALTRGGRLRDDAAMALVLSIGFGLGVVLLSVVQSLPVGGQAGLKGFILGQAAGMSAFDAQLIGGLALLAVLAVTVLFRPLAALCFDREFAAAVGLPVRLLDLALMGLMLAVTVAGLRAVGLVLVVGLMVIPAATARLLTERLQAMVPLAALLGAFAAWLGASLSATLPGLPTGATIVLVACALFLLALVVAPRRGVLAFAWRQARLSLLTARDHALRSAMATQELATQESGAPGRMARWAAIGRSAGWSAWQRALLPWWLRRAGLATVETTDDTIALTPAGLALAAELTRRHRHWEQALPSAGGLPPGIARREAEEMGFGWPAGVGPEDGLAPPGETGMTRS